MGEVIIWTGSVGIVLVFSGLAIAYFIKQVRRDRREHR